MQEKWNYPAALTTEQNQVVLGSLFGDGCITVGDSGSCWFAETHTAPQVPYLKWKAKILKSCGSRISHAKSGNSHLSTRRVPLLTGLREMFYPEGKKIVPLSALEQIDALGLAVWFMDDGSFKRHFVLATDSFSLAENNVLIAWFSSRWLVNPSILVLRKNGKRYFRLRFRVEDSLVILKTILPHLHPIFRRKWRTDDENTFRPRMTMAEQMALANRRRTELIKAGVLTVRYNQGTVRLKSG